MLNELTENTELLPGRSKLWTQGSTSQMLAVYSAWGLHSVTTHQENLENDVFHRKEIMHSCKEHI